MDISCYVIDPGVKLKPIWYAHVPLIRSIFERKSLIKTTVEISDSLTKVILDSEISLTKVHKNIYFFPNEDSNNICWFLKITPWNFLIESVANKVTS